MNTVVQLNTPISQCNAATDLSFEGKWQFYSTFSKSILECNNEKIIKTG